MEAKQCAFYTACRLQQKLLKDHSSGDFDPFSCWAQTVGCDDQKKDMEKRCSLFYPLPSLFHNAVSNMVHELKQPLATISLPAELTLRDLHDLQRGKGSIEKFFPQLEERLKCIIASAMETGRRIEAIRNHSLPVKVKKRAPYVRG